MSDSSLIALSLSKRPETRYQNGDQFARDLRAVMATLPVDAAVSLQARSRADSLGGTKPASASPVHSNGDKTAVLGAASRPADSFAKTMVHARAIEDPFDRTVLQSKASVPAFIRPPQGGKPAPDIEI